MTKTEFVKRGVESFTLGDSASIESLRPNQKGEVISPRSSLLIMHAFLAEKGGMAYRADLEAELTRHFSGVWGPDDLRPHKATGRPRWLNSLDWAKVEAGKGRTTMDWLKAKPLSKAGFKKNCGNCRRKNPLAAKSCGRCGKAFPVPANRTHKLLESHPVQAKKKRTSRRAT